jgi:transcriptional regulator of acetoin/glycerol metabolism
MTRQIEGVIDIACRASEANRLLLAMAMEIASEIEEELFLHSSERERALLRSFLREAHPSVWSVISISGQFMMASAAAARLLDGTDQIVLWEQASQAAALQCERSVILTLADGRQIQARCKPVESHGRTVGVVIELDPDSLEQTELQQILAACGRSTATSSGRPGILGSPGRRCTPSSGPTASSSTAPSSEPAGG